MVYRPLGNACGRSHLSMRQRYHEALSLAARTSGSMVFESPCSSNVFASSRSGPQHASESRSEL
jgi:hypothetical protein